jgi:hypothetical protein
MKYALVSFVEKREDGFRVAQVVESSSQKFETHSSLRWIECEDSVIADVFYYKQSTNQFLLIPVDHAQIAKDTRDVLLIEMDFIVSNPIVWESFSEEKKNEYRVYRQALLDIEKQEGYPENVIFPTKPQ